MEERGGLSRDSEGKSRGIRIESSGLWVGRRFECQTGKEVAPGVLGQVLEADPETLGQGVGWEGSREPSSLRRRLEGREGSHEQGQKLSMLWLPEYLALA